jgi:hypothetical protein
MLALLIVFTLNGGVTTAPMPDVATCERVRKELLGQFSSDAIGGSNSALRRSACVPVKQAGGAPHVAAE